LGTLPVLYHLIWRRWLVADLSAVLSHRTIVRVSPNVANLSEDVAHLSQDLPPRMERVMFERPGVLSVGDQVVFGAAVHTVVAISGTKIRLLSGPGEASVVALPFLLAAEDFELVGSAPAAPKIEPRGLLDELPEKVLAAAKDWERPGRDRAPAGIRPGDAVDDGAGEGEGGGVDRGRAQDKCPYGSADAAPLSQARVVGSGRLPLRPHAGAHGQVGGLSHSSDPVCGYQAMAVPGGTSKGGCMAATRSPDMPASDQRVVPPRPWLRGRAARPGIAAKSGADSVDLCESTWNAGTNSTAGSRPRKRIPRSPCFCSSTR
jgi:hypothetical protein